MIASNIFMQIRNMKKKQSGHGSIKTTTGLLCISDDC